MKLHQFLNPTGWSNLWGGDILSELNTPSDNDGKELRQRVLNWGRRAGEDKLRWDKMAMIETQSATDRIAECMKYQARLQTEARDSLCVTESDVKSAFRDMIVEVNPPKWKVITRVCTILCGSLSGVLISRGIERSDSILVLLGALFALVIVIIHEGILQHRR
jgi:hypothetical protein